MIFQQLTRGIWFALGLGMISVIIPARNEADPLPACLSALASELDGLPHEVIVVDHGSTDDTARIARQYGAIVVSCADARTAAELRNCGVRHAQGSTLAFIDADVLVCSGWRDGLFDAMATPDAVSGDLYGIGNNPTWLDRTWFDPAMYPRANFLPAGNMVISRTLFDQVGGFDATLVTGEDADLCRRVGCVRRLPSLVTHHLGNPSTLVGFIRREAWHGEGDFKTVRTALASRVVIVSLAWSGLVILAAPLMPLRPLVGVLLFCAALGVAAGSAFVKFGPRLLLPRTCLYCAYFAARTISGVRRLRGVSVWHHGPIL